MATYRAVRPPPAQKPVTVPDRSTPAAVSYVVTGFRVAGGRVDVETVETASGRDSA